MEGFTNLSTRITEVRISLLVNPCMRGEIPVSLDLCSTLVQPQRCCWKRFTKQAVDRCWSMCWEAVSPAYPLLQTCCLITFRNTNDEMCLYFWARLGQSDGAFTHTCSRFEWMCCSCFIHSRADRWQSMIEVEWLIVWFYKYLRSWTKHHVQRTWHPVGLVFMWPGPHRSSWLGAFSLWRV